MAVVANPGSVVAYLRLALVRYLNTSIPVVHCDVGLLQARRRVADAFHAARDCTAAPFKHLDWLTAGNVKHESQSGLMTA